MKRVLKFQGGSKKDLAGTQRLWEVLQLYRDWVDGDGDLARLSSCFPSRTTDRSIWLEHVDGRLMGQIREVSND